MNWWTRRRKLILASVAFALLVLLFATFNFITGRQLAEMADNKVDPSGVAQVALSSRIERLEYWSTFYKTVKYSLLGLSVFVAVIGFLADLTAEKFAGLLTESLSIREKLRTEATKLAIAQADARAAEAGRGAAEARKEAADATLLARKYESSIAESNKRAAEAERIAAQAKLDLAKLTTPRRLSRSQKLLVIEAIMSFAGQKYTLWASPGSGEPVDLINDIEEALHGAKWSYEKSKALILIGGRIGTTSLTGLKVRVAPSRMSTLFAAAKALGNALRAVNLVDVDVEPSPELENHPDTIHLMVGSK